MGGADNIISCHHCLTRLRFKLKNQDLAKANQKALTDLDGVVKIIIFQDLFQVVIGTHVPEVYEEVVRIGKIDSSKAAEAAAESTGKRSLLTGLVDFISGSFTPIIPALSGAGMVKAALAILVLVGAFTKDSQSYKFLEFVSDAVFYFLPLFLATTAAKKLNCNPILALGLAAMLVHPTWVAWVAGGEPVQVFGFIPLTLATYSSSVIPILLIVWVQSYVERYVDRFTPNSLKIIMVPMFVFLITAVVGFAVVGPLGSIVGNQLAKVFDWLTNNIYWAPVFLYGTFQPLLVMFGIHYALVPLSFLQLSAVGYDSIISAGGICSNMALATAGLVAGLRSRDARTRQIGTSGAITAYMGITEPLLYGVVLPKKYPLIATLIGGGLGSLYSGLMFTRIYGAALPGAPALLLFISEDTMNFVNALIGVGITIVSTAAITYFFSLREEKKALAADTAAPAAAETPAPAQPAPVAPAQPAAATELAGFAINTPVEGVVKPLSACADPAFADGDMGQGVVITPSNGLVRAPFDGKVVTVFPTKHAVVLAANNGVEVLIHVGIDTVGLNGAGFTSYVEAGQEIKAGDKILAVDLEFVQSKGLVTDIPVLVMEHDCQTFDPGFNGNVSFGKEVIRLA